MAKPISQIDVQRFWQWVDVGDPDECWEWTGSNIDGRHRKGSRGYGQFRQRRNGVDATWRAHRAAYELLVGPIPEGLVIDHLCMNTLCCNPQHLEAVTSAENTRRAARANRGDRRRDHPDVGKPGFPTHCRNGHALTAENTAIYAATGGPACRTCRRAKAQRWRDRRQAASA